MLTDRQQAMNLSPNNDIRRVYRKRPEPVRIVSLSSLNKTAVNRKTKNPEFLVNSSNANAIHGQWQPMPRPTIEVNVSPSSWSGLHSRVLASRKISAEAF